mmetsp:Transcript_100250/g.283904  ORF Transcript_100250/g.283904 Transcript_100250/m.283904 type:complete len:214 (+) Transcript_100250:13-654(+)
MSARGILGPGSVFQGGRVGCPAADAPAPTAIWAGPRAGGRSSAPRRARRAAQLSARVAALPARHWMAHLSRHRSLHLSSVPSELADITDMFRKEMFGEEGADLPDSRACIRCVMPSSWVSRDAVLSLRSLSSCCLLPSLLSTSSMVFSSAAVFFSSPLRSLSPSLSSRCSSSTSAWSLEAASLLVLKSKRTSSHRDFPWDMSLSCSSCAPASL